MAGTNRLSKIFTREQFNRRKNRKSKVGVALEKIGNIWGFRRKLPTN